MIRQFLTLTVMLLALLAVPVGLRQSPWYVLSPGGSYDLRPRVHVPEERRQEMGRLAFTAVYAQPANWAQVLGARISRTEELVPAEQIRPPGASQEEVNESNRRQIDESKPVAAAVGLRAAGYEVSVTGKGAEVSGTVSGMPAEGILERQDLIVEVDGVPTRTTTDVIEAVRRREVGTDVRLGILRGGERREVTVGTVSAPGEPGQPAIGVRIGTMDFEVNLPFPVEVDTDTVGGPSAGLMMALAVLDAVTVGDLTHGQFVAGTGTINVDGRVGPVGGVAEKVVAAERDGASIFLVPRGNVGDLRSRPTRARVVPIDTFDEAIRFLCALPLQAGASSPPAPCEEPRFGATGS